MILSLVDPEPTETTASALSLFGPSLTSVELPLPQSAPTAFGGDDAAELNDEVHRQVEAADPWPWRHGGIND